MVDIGDSFSETSEQGWGSRIMESIKGIVVGLALFLGSFVLLFWNEGRAVHRAQDLEEGQASCLSVPSDVVDPANQGKLIFTSGTAEPEGEVTDETFNISATAIKLRRSVEMFQWIEKTEKKKKKKMGGGKTTTTTYSYSTQWSEDLEDSSSFKKPEGHQNPSSMPFESDSWIADKVTLGAFTLPNNLASDINAWQQLSLPEGYVDSFAVETSIEPQFTGDTIYLGATPATPAVGDVRITFEEVPASDVSVISQQNAESFAPYITKRKSTLQELRLGLLSMEEFFAKLHAENNMMTWILRLVGFLAMAIGIYMMGAPLAVLGDVLPFLGSMIGAGIAIFAGLVALSLSLTTIAIAWLFYRPLLGIGLLVVAAGGIFLLKKMGKPKAAV